MSLSIENIMNTTFGEVSSEIRGSYKKTILVRQYETEVIEVESVLKLETEVSGAERMFISALLQVQLEYTAYCQLAFKGLVTETELKERRKQLEDGAEAIKNKAEQVLGKSLDKYLSVNMN